ncbi:alanine racemase [Butyrivibrio sp. AE2032]|uniref:alanine racemase n=1 Tax=Butyrivibrio sp. AE2032 TaxID=1458463 RepID=UPI000556DC8B|nr:alanine racemase [Butyrivibrio sp. AE2032]
MTDYSTGTDSIFDRSCVEIDLDALKHNFEQIKKATTPGTDIMAVVKADAYGHGALETAKTLIDSGAAGLCLATIDEAVELRKHGIDVPMMTLGYTDPSRFADAVRYDVEQAVYSFEIARTLSDEAVRKGKTLKIHVKLDTGMGRIGFKTDGSETDEIVKACRLPGLEPYGVFSHFAVADTDDDEYTERQFGLFMDQIDALEKSGIHFTKRHICNSAGILRFPGMHLDMVRAGIILYGLMPPGCPKPVVDVDLKPVMNWYAKVIHVKTVPAGSTISYGRHFTAGRPTEVTTVGIGYADGLSRRLSNGFELIIGGKKCPIIGNICMDMCMVDTTDLETRPQIGDKVTVFGSTRSADELADALGTINYEITCDVGKRVRRLYIGG